MMGGRERGFVFLETMTALLIVAMMLAIAFASIAQTARATRNLVEKRQAMLVAKSALALVGGVVPLSAGAADGVDGPYVWRLEMTLYAPPGGLGRAGRPMLVSVTAGTRASPALVRLNTLRLAPEPA